MMYDCVYCTVEQYTDAIQYIQLGWQSPTITSAGANLNEPSPRTAGIFPGFSDDHLLIVTLQQGHFYISARPFT